MAGDENNRNIGMRTGKLGLEVESAHSPQAHIEHQATHRVGRLALKKLPGRGEDLAPEPDRPHQRLQASADINVVVHHENYGTALVVCCVMTAVDPALAYPALT